MTQHATVLGTVVSAIAAIIIAWFTIVLARATTGMLNAASEQGRLTQKSIDLARDEFSATHRPEVIVHNFQVFRKTFGEEEAIGARFVVVNSGTSDATILDIAGTIFRTAYLRPSSSMPSIGYAGRSLKSGEFLNEVEISGTPPDTAEVDFEAGFGSPSAAGDAKLWCIGRIVYADTQGRRRETGFCRSYDTVNERWVKEPASDYEYSY